MNKPKLFFTVGLPGASKSSWLESHKQKLNITIHSSDSIREELGDVNDMSKNELVFNTLHKRVKEDLLNGKNVAYDSTGLKRKNRLHFLREIKDIPCEKICVLFATPIECCKRNNSNRERKVPEDVIERMIRSFEVPAYCESWDEIQIVWWNYESEGIEYDFFSDLQKWFKESHNSPHHSLTIGQHMWSAYDHYLRDMQYSNELQDVNDREKYLLSIATLLHDCGKTHVKSLYDKNVMLSEKATYYEHHNYGAYLSLFYLNDMFYEKSFTDDEILYISLLINCHMRHFMAYKDSENARERDRRLFGDDFIKKLDVLHECDLAAH